MRILTDIVVLPEGVMTLREELTGSIDFIQFYADSYGGFARNGDTVDMQTAIDASTDTARQLMDKL